MCVLIYNIIHVYMCIKVYVNLDFKSKQGNELESPLFYFHGKKAAQVRM